MEKSFKMNKFFKLLCVVMMFVLSLSVTGCFDDDGISDRKVLAADLADCIVKFPALADGDIHKIISVRARNLL